MRKPALIGAALSAAAALVFVASPAAVAVPTEPTLDLTAMSFTHGQDVDLTLTFGPFNKGKVIEQPSPIDGEPTPTPENTRVARWVDVDVKSGSLPGGLTLEMGSIDQDPDVANDWYVTAKLTGKVSSLSTTGTTTVCFITTHNMYRVDDPEGRPSRTKETSETCIPVTVSAAFVGDTDTKLAKTGAELNGYLFAGVAALIAGAGAVAFARRRAAQQ